MDRSKPRQGGHAAYTEIAKFVQQEIDTQSVVDGFAEVARRKNNPALSAFESLEQYVREFEVDLDSEHEVGARLVSFGSEVTFHVRQIGYSLPNLITFDGITNDGNRVKLIQHVSQLSVLLVAMKTATSAPRQPIGFLRPSNTGE